MRFDKEPLLKVSATRVRYYIELNINCLYPKIILETLLILLHCYYMQIRAPASSNRKGFEIIFRQVVDNGSVQSRLQSHRAMQKRTRTNINDPNGVRSCVP
jgi:hypothetical protein